MYIIFTVTLHCCVSEPFSRHWFCWFQCKAPPRVILGRSSCSLGCCILACELILVAVLCEYRRHHKWMGVEGVGQSARSAWMRRTVGSFTRTVCYNNHLSYNCDIRETRVIITITSIMQPCISTWLMISFLSFERDSQYLAGDPRVLITARIMHTCL